MLFGVLFHVCLYIYCSKLKLDIFKGMLPKTSTSTLPEKYLKYSKIKTLIASLDIYLQLVTMVTLALLWKALNLNH